MRKRNLNGSVGFEKLELRRLLAADCGLPILDAIDPVASEVATFDCFAEETSTDATSTAEVEVIEEGPTSADSDPRNLDLSDGMDGFFGEINAENPSETLQLTAAEDGNVNVVLTTALGDAHAALTVTTSQGDVIETRNESVDGFEMATFEVAAGETYQLSVNAEAGCEGHFQLTASFTGKADLHANDMGDDSTEITFEETSAKFAGELEAAGDIDTFRFTSMLDGEATLDLYETVDDARVSLDVSVYDADGNMLTEGRTNELVKSSFDVQRGSEYFIALSAVDGQISTYVLGLDLNETPAPVDAATDGETTDAADDNVVEETPNAEVDTAEPDDSIVADDDSRPADSDPVDNTTDDSEPGDPVDVIDPDAGDPEIVDGEVCDKTDPVDEPAEPPIDVGDPVDAMDPVDAIDPVDGEVGIEVIDDGDAVMYPQPSDDLDQVDPGSASGDVDSAGSDLFETDDNLPDENASGGDLSDDLAEALVECDDDLKEGESEPDDILPPVDPEAPVDQDQEPVGGDLIGGDDADCDLVKDDSSTDPDLSDLFDNFFAELGDDVEVFFGFTLGNNFDRFLSRV